MDKACLLDPYTYTHVLALRFRAGAIEKKDQPAAVPKTSARHRRLAVRRSLLIGSDDALGLAAQDRVFERHLRARDVDLRLLCQDLVLAG